MFRTYAGTPSPIAVVLGLGFRVWGLGLGFRTYAGTPSPIVVVLSSMLRGLNGVMMGLTSML